MIYKSIIMVTQLYTKAFNFLKTSGILNILWMLCIWLFHYSLPKYCLHMHCKPVRNTEMVFRDLLVRTSIHIKIIFCVQGEVVAAPLVEVVQGVVQQAPSKEQGRNYNI